MLRILVGLALTAACATTALAQGDPIAERKAAMKGVGQVFYGDLGKMTRGDIPYDQAKVDAALKRVADSAQKLPALYPDNSKSGEETAALPRIWETKADFDARYARLASAAASREGTIKDLAGLKAAYPEMGKECSGCHELYRARKN